MSDRELKIIYLDGKYCKGKLYIKIVVYFRFFLSFVQPNIAYY